MTEHRSLTEAEFFFNLGAMFRDMQEKLVEIRDQQSTPDPAIIETLQRIEANVSALTDAVDKLVAAFNSNQTLLAQALATEATDQATITALQAAADATAVDVNASINEINAALGTPPPADTPPADTPPVDTPPADAPPADTPPA